MILAHATCVDLDGGAVLLRGASGSGKSDLALRLIDAGAVLVADDQVRLECRDGRLFASPPAALAGLLEVRGLGIVRLPHRADAWVRLVVDLVAPGDVERLPEDEEVEIAGVALPRVALAPFEASAMAKLRLAAAEATKRTR
ncbi:MAG: HPr kinase/phosphatase C-terminal domain-containing protein [Alphaproteobacteria bacterium]|jgi:serine kinase of HPr protein (carbohydrate metabolism regulator)|nr:HPr kinase/phosphatase C-terminal domain-containing protein [Alphaproteobacteria bacterium]